MKQESEDLERQRFNIIRFFAGISFGIIIILSVLLLNKLGFFFICAVLIVISVYELFFIYDLNAPEHFIFPAVLSVITAYVYVFFGGRFLIPVFFISIFLILLKGILFFDKKSGLSFLIGTFAIIYAGFFLSFLLKIFDLPDGRLLLLLLFALVWASDIFAYYGGRHFGRHKLYESLSPKKTVEGALFGFIFAIFTALIFKAVVFEHNKLNILWYVFICAITVIAGIIGDLAESLIKRSGGKKDSGRLIPGHGGILDRIDSLILAAPSFYFLLLFVLQKK